MKSPSPFSRHWVFIVMNLWENINRIKEVMGISPKPIDISYYEHLIKTFSDGDSEISEDNESDEKNIVIEKIKDNDFTNDPETFLESLQKSSRKEMLTDYTIDDLKDMMTYKLNGYDIGYALKQDDKGNFNEIVSVFNNSGIKGVGDDLIQSAIRNGGRYLDHFDGFLF
jgi:hypothetical protein